MSVLLKEVAKDAGYFYQKWGSIMGISVAITKIIINLEHI
jgi:endonuclease III-like uncharacterized protein